MRNTRTLWLFFAATLMLGGVVSGQDNRREQADRNRGNPRPAQRKAKRAEAPALGVQLISKGQDHGHAVPGIPYCPPGS